MKAMSYKKSISNEALTSFSKCFLLAFLSLAIIFSAFTVVRIICQFELQDFSVYYQGVQNFLSRQNPYMNSQPEKYIYPPSSLVFLAPIGWLPYRLAEDVWTLISFVSVMIAIIVLFKSLNKKKSLIIFLMVFGFFMLSFPAKFTLGMGQINMFILLLISLSFYFFRRKRSYLSGIFLAIALAIKLTPIVLLLFYIRKKQWKIVISCLVFSFAFNLSGMLFLGTSATGDYWNNVFPYIPTIGNAAYYNQALTGWLARSLIPDSISKVINYLVFGSLLLISFVKTNTTLESPESELSEYGLFILSVLIGSGLAWQHHFVITLIPFTALIFSTKSWGKRFCLLTFLLLLAYILIALNIKDPSVIASNYFSKFLLSHALYGSVLLYILLIISLKLQLSKTNKRRNKTL